MQQVVGRVTVPQPPGLSDCTFDGQALSGGPLVAAGAATAAGNQYPLAAVLTCAGNICRDSYLATYSYGTTTKTLVRSPTAWCHCTSLHHRIVTWWRALSRMMLLVISQHSSTSALALRSCRAAVSTTRCLFGI